MKGIIIINPEKCLACKTCEIECSLCHSSVKTLSLAALSKNPPGIKVEKLSRFAVPIQCCHCEAAPCVAVCPARAIIKNEKTSAIVINRKLCVGCGACVVVCPYGIPELIPNKGGAIKCDFCFERLIKGKKPACVSGCPTGALRFEIIEEVIENGKNTSER